MRPVKRGNAPLNEEGNPKVYRKYGNARRDLVNRLGEYCSYCEMHLDTSLAVEHIIPKTHFPHLELAWSNFLLACTNCNSTKGAEPESGDLSPYYWPHIHNTFLAFDYDDEGVTKAASHLNPAQTQKAKRTIDLMGLDAKPDKENASDRRWQNRQEAWRDAQDCKADIADTLSDLAGRISSERLERVVNRIKDGAIRTAKAKGYWSIWMTVFQNDADMIARLVNASNFKGTDTACFDRNFQALERVGGEL